MASLNREEETYYNNYFDLFRTEGWKQLISELTTNALGVNSLESVKDESDMYFRKGQLNILGSLINLETMINNAFDEQTADDQSI
jgi:hypothetical protein